jgi:hypothetical protein
MAENINKHLQVLKQNEKVIIISGDAHFSTLETMVRITKPNGEKTLEKFSPNGIKISVNFTMIHPCIIWSSFNHKIKSSSILLDKRTYV